MKIPSLLKLARKRKPAKLLSNCEVLPVTVFFKIIETGNLQLLVVDGKATDSELNTTWENILFEFEKLTNSNEYHMHIREQGEDVRRINRLNALVALYYIGAYGGEDISEDASFWGVNGTDYNAVKLEIMRERTRLNIASIEKSKEKPKQDFYELWTAVENGLNRSIDVENCSVRKWVALCKSLEKKADYYKKMNSKHGGQD